MCHASCCHAFRAIDLSTGSSASFAIPLFMNLKGWRHLCSNLIHYYWHPLCGAAIGVHYRFLGAISESCLSVEDQCSCPHPYQRCEVLQVYKRCYSSQYTPYTIHVSIDVDRHVNFVRPSIRSHSVSFVCFICSLLLTWHLSRTIVLELTCILLSL